MGGVGGYDQLCCPASPKLMLGLDLGQGCDNILLKSKKCEHLKILNIFFLENVKSKEKRSKKSFKLSDSNLTF